MMGVRFAPRVIFVQAHSGVDDIVRVHRAAWESVRNVEDWASAAVSAMASVSMSGLLSQAEDARLAGVALSDSLRGVRAILKDSEVAEYGRE